MHWYWLLCHEAVNRWSEKGATSLSKSSMMKLMLFNFEFGAIFFVSSSRSHCFQNCLPPNYLPPFFLQITKHLWNVLCATSFTLPLYALISWNFPSFLHKVELLTWYRSLNGDFMLWRWACWLIVVIFNSVLAQCSHKQPQYLIALLSLGHRRC